MKKYILVIIISLSFLETDVFAQDNCAGATTLCAGSTRNSSTNGATTVGSDPALSCGDGIVHNSVWFTLLAVNNGNATVTVNNINNNPGLDMEIYTGACGALVTTGQCASGSSATAGTMSLSFAVVSGTTYYIMVDGNAGNQEAFDIVATTPDNAVVARPDANFNASTLAGCAPLTVNFTNSTQLHGGSNLTYEWRVDAGSYVPAPALVDTTITFGAIGTHTVTLRVCNTECGCKTVSQDIDVQDLFPAINYLPTNACIGTEIFFDGSAAILPDPPFVDPNITSWDWDFGDPASGPSNTASGQSVSHTFTNTSSSYTVTLTVQGVCGPKVVNTIVNLAPKPTVTITGAADICEGSDLNMGSTVVNATNPISYDWVGAGSFSCTNCPATIVSALPAGGPYNFTLTITDSLGCVADTFVDINVNELPTVFAGGFITVCPGDSAQLNATPANGTPPYSYQWAPSAGLNNDTIFDPVTYNTNNQTYCVTVTDSKGCTSNPDCVFIDEFPPPTIVPASANLCTTQLPLQNTFTVNGAGAGSVYSWSLSPDYALITGAAGDSSSIDVTFPSTPGTYNFIAVVNDGITGCTDTVPAAFTVDSGLNMNVTGPTDICDGDSAVLVASGADTYEWSASPAYSFADSSLATQVVSPLANTVFTVTGTQGSCAQTITHSLDLNPKPVADIDTIDPICGCDSVTLDGSLSTGGMSYLWSSQNGSGISSPSSIVTTAYVCMNDSISLTVTDPGSGCSETISTFVESRIKPHATVTVTPDLICEGVATAITLDGTGSNTDPGTIYHWTSNSLAAVIADTTALTTSSNVSTITIFYLTVTDTFGCDSTASDTVNIFPPPSLSASPPFICTTDTVLESTLTITGASVGSTYSWTTIPGCVLPSSTSADSQLFDFSACPAAVYTFDVTVTDAVTTCVTNVSETVTVINGVVLTVSNDTSYCEGGTATLSASGANTFLWSTGDTTSSIAVGGLTAAGSPYSFIVTGTVGGCSASDTIEVIVNPVPATVVTVADTAVCENDPASVYSVSPGPGGSTFSWSISGGIILAGQGTPDVIVSWATPGLGQLNVVETNSFGCDGPLISIFVIISPLPVAPIITGNDTVCQDAFETYFVNANAGSTYDWTVTGGSAVTGTTGTVNTFQWGSAGTGTLEVFETTSAGCIGPNATLNVLINPRPTPVVVIGNNIVCDNIIEIYTAPSPDSIYTWTVANSLQDTVNSTTDTLTVNWASGASFGLITVFETNSFGCNSDTSSLNIAISHQPVVTIPNDTDTVCNNATYQLVANVSNGSIKWTTDGSGAFNNDTIEMPVYTPSPSDTGDVHFYLVASLIPCSDDTGSIVLNFLPSPVVSISGPAAPICYGTIDTLIATGGGTYIWTPGGIPNDTITIAPLVTTTYTVAVTNSLGCTTFDSITVDVIPPGIPDAGNNQIICVGDAVTLAGSQVNATGLVWTTSGDGVFSPDSISANAVYTSGPADSAAASVMIYLTTTGACLNLTDTINVSIQYPPTIFAGNDTTVSSDKSGAASVPLLPTGSNIHGVIWATSGSGTFSPSDTSFNAIYSPSPSDYDQESIVLIVTTTGVCTPVSDSIEIDFSPLIIPNVFTPFPATPGFNDYFVIRFISPRLSLKIWDRWGQMVYTSDYYQNDWDAYGLKSDVYFYLVQTEEKSYKGWVQVMKD